MKYISAKAVLATAAMAVLFLFLSRASSWWGVSFFAALLLVWVFVCVRFAPRLTKRAHDRAMVMVPLCVAVAGFALLYILVEGARVRWSVFGLFIFIVFVALHTLYRSEVPQEFRARSLVPVMRMSLYAGLFSFFAASFGIMIFLQPPLWVFAVLSAVAAGFAAWSLFTMAGLPEVLVPALSAGMGVLVFEAFWLLAFLPLGYAVAGWLLTFVLYSGVQICSWSLQEGTRLRKRSSRRLWYALAATVVLMLVSRWT